MTSVLQELGEQYNAALQTYLAGEGESALRRAYELGRRALIESLGVLEITVLYHQALSDVLEHTLTPDENVRVIRAGENFFLESLAPFEMTHRGYRETNVALRDSDERYRELFENANDILFTTDMAGNITSLNRAGEQITGFRRDEKDHLRFAQLVGQEHLGLVLQMVHDRVAGKGPSTYEMELLAKDGRRIPVEVSSALLFKGGEPDGIQGIARDITERRRAKQAVLRLNAALEEEARRIAHALHDEAGQLLASVHIALEEVTGDKPQQVGERVHEIKELLYEIEEQLRRLSHELRPTILDDLGLQPALEFLTQGVSKRTGLQISVEFSQDRRLPHHIETALYRIAQEALNNVSKHAHATHVKIQITIDSDTRCLIRDDGIGFDVEAVLNKKGQPGLGLIGVRGRLEDVGGLVKIRSGQGQGTELDITIPREK